MPYNVVQHLFSSLPLQWKIVKDMTITSIFSYVPYFTLRFCNKFLLLAKAYPERVELVYLQLRKLPCNVVMTIPQHAVP